MTNYFTKKNNKSIFIADPNDLNTKVKILDAIKNYLANDDRNLWTSELQNLITIHSSKTKNSIEQNRS